MIAVIRDYIPFYKRNIRLAVPVMITQAGQVFVQMVDNVMIGHLGTAQFAGASFANSIFLIGMVFCTCFTQGLTPFVGQCYGKGEHHKVTEYFKSSFVLDIAVSLVVVALLLAIIPFMGHMGQDSDILVYAKEYYVTITLSLIPFAMFFAIRNFSEGIGITKYAMYITVIANLLNVFLNWVFIYGKLGAPEMGVKGAAFSTLICRILMFVAFAILIFIIKDYKRFTSGIRAPFLNLGLIREMFPTSLSIALQGLAEMVAFSLSGIMMGWFGKIALAAHQCTTLMSTCSFMIAQGIGAAATIRVSHQFGERRYKDSQKAGFAAMHMAVVFMGICGIIYIIFRKSLPHIFSTDPQVVDLASKLIVVMATYQVFDAMQLTNGASLRALKDVKLPLLYLCISYYVISLPLGYFCAKYLNFGPAGIWFGLVIGLMCVAFLFFFRFKKKTDGYIKGRF